MSRSKSKSKSKSNSVNSSNSEGRRKPSQQWPRGNVPADHWLLNKFLFDCAKEPDAAAKRDCYHRVVDYEKAVGIRAINANASALASELVADNLAGNPLAKSIHLNI
jgi:hypothetical protein